MTDKERLEEIKAQYHILTRNGYDLGAWDEPFSWLIEQVERVQELERQLKNQKRHKMTYRKIAKEYHGEIWCYREALEEILNLRNNTCPTEYVIRVESIARKALEKTE